MRRQLLFVGTAALVIASCTATVRDFQGTGGAGGAGASSGSAVSSSKAASSSSSSAVSSSSVASSSVASSSSGMPQTATCSTYCAKIAATCVDAATTEQYASMASCLNVCATFPQGNVGDMTGNSLECRAYHTFAAASSPLLHCPHAGPTGGAMSGLPNDDGPCGNGCEAFCQLGIKFCPAQFPDVASCLTSCKTFNPDPTPYTIADTSKNDFGCRMYHLTVAAVDASSAATHCPHTVAASLICSN